MTQSHLDSSAEQRGVKVRPLEWEQLPGNLTDQKVWCFDDERTHWIVQNEGGKYVWCQDLTLSWLPASPVRGTFHTLEEAQEAVWQDHQRYILEAITPVTPASIRTDALREAAGTRIFIDCEFNGWMGELVSFAMVAEGGREFYAVLPLPPDDKWDPWVYDNVQAVLGKEPVNSYADFRLAFLEFLRGFDRPHIVADWPADLYYFNAVLLGSGHAESVLRPCTMELVDCNYTSAIPHNALEDARAIRDAILSLIDTPPDGGWQPIETAPRDGTNIDLWGTRNGIPQRFADAAWIRSVFGSEPFGEPLWLWPSKDNYGAFEVTHWRPLPAPPSPSKDKDNGK